MRTVTRSNRLLAVKLDRITQRVTSSPAQQAATILVDVSHLRVPFQMSWLASVAWLPGVGWLPVAFGDFVLAAARLPAAQNSFQAALKLGAEIPFSG